MGEFFWWEGLGKVGWLIMCVLDPQRLASLTSGRLRPGLILLLDLPLVFLYDLYFQTFRWCG